MNLKGIAVVKTQMWLCGASLALAGCAAEKPGDMSEAPHDTAATTQWTSDEGSFDIIAFIEGDDIVLEPVAMEAPPADTNGSDGTVLPVPAEEQVAATGQATDAEADAGTTDVAVSPAGAPTETSAAPEPAVAAADADADTGDAADNAADTSAVPAPAVAAAEPETGAAEAETVRTPPDAPPAVAAAGPEPEGAPDDEAVQEPVAVRIEPPPEPETESDQIETIVVGDQVVHVVPATTAPAAKADDRGRSGVPTVTLANCQSAPVPADVIASIESRLRKAGFTVAGSFDGDYLVVCGRIPPRTMWGRSMPQAGGPPLSFVRASSLAEPLGVSLKRPGGGTWQAIVEVAFDPANAAATRKLHLREIQTIYSGDPRQVRRRDTRQLSRLDDALDAWAAAYGAGNGR